MAVELGGEEIRGSKISRKINEAGCEPETWDLRETDGGFVSSEDMGDSVLWLVSSELMIETETCNLIQKKPVSLCISLL